MATVLITGFGPFPGAPRNPSALLAVRVARTRRVDPHHCLVTHVFPTSYAAVDRELPALIGKHKPQAVLLFGLAARTPWVRVEQFARNRSSRLHPDVDGVAATTPAIARGASAVRGRGPLVRLLAAARRAGVAARLSHDAGTYLCNYVYWRALEAAARPGGPRLVVFVHIPPLRGARRSRSRPTLPKLVRAGEAILIAALADLRAR
jgi:pyroglutamyl-peptidase